MPARSQTRSRLRVIGGIALLVAGAILALPGVPGPGIALIVAGLLILRDHYEWAGRLLAWMHRRFEWLTKRGKEAHERSGEPR